MRHISCLCRPEAIVSPDSRSGSLLLSHREPTPHCQCNKTECSNKSDPSPMGNRGAAQVIDMKPPAAPMPPEYFPTVIPDEHKIIVNVSGLIYEMDKRQLNKHPKTLLGNRKKRRRIYDKAHDEYFLDRHRGTFEAIESFYTKVHVFFLSITNIIFYYK